MRAIGRLVKSLTLKPVASISYSFDPYHKNVRSIRDVLFLLNGTNLIDTNPDCRTKVNIKADRSEPNIQVAFNDGHNLIFKTQNLTTMDILEFLNKQCNDREPKSEETSSNALPVKKARKK